MNDEDDEKSGQEPGDLEGESTSSASSADEVEEQDFLEYSSNTFSAKQMDILSKGWTAFVVGIIAPSQ